MVNSKHAFWQALVVTLIVFGIGLLLGFFLEIARANYTDTILTNSEITLLDEQLREKAIEDLNVSCSQARESTFRFADQIYAEAQKLEKYDSASQLSDKLKLLHRRYDLLRTMLWFESEKLKERCGTTFHTLVYFYDYSPQSVDVRAEQAFFSRLLIDLKYKYPDQILLIPIATNMDLESVNVILEDHSITSSPTILIDGKSIISTVVTMEELERTVFERNK